MRDLFFQLIDDAISEIARREPDYLQRFPPAFSDLQARAREYQSNSLLRDLSVTEIANSLEAGVDYVAEQCGDVRLDDPDFDPTAGLLLDSIVDALAAQRQSLCLRPNVQLPRPLAGILHEDYQERRTSVGRRYFIRKSGERPLLLISACGIPLAIWSSFLGDAAHDFKIVAIESRTADILAGGMPNYAELTDDTTDIVAALDCERIDKADAVGWCNGCRIAIDLASRCPGRLRSLALLSPTLRGVAGIAPQPSPFEDTMTEIFDTIAQQPELAAYFAKTFVEQPQTVDWNLVGHDPVRRAAVLFGLPAKEHSKALLAPMLDPDFLINYGRRAAVDERYPIKDALLQLDIPILLLTGDHDTITNSGLSCAALKLWGPRGVHAKLKGGGHYLQDLQYPYFLAILNEFYAGREPASSARIAIELIGRDTE